MDCAICVSQSPYHCDLPTAILRRAQSSQSTFLAKFADYVETTLLSNEELLIQGDFNIHIDVAGDSDANELSDFFESVGLQQHVEQHTHVQGHTLDLVISWWSDNIIKDLPHVSCLTMLGFCSVSSQ